MRTPGSRKGISRAQCSGLFFLLGCVLFSSHMLVSYQYAALAVDGNRQASEGASGAPRRAFFFRTYMATIAIRLSLTACRCSFCRHSVIFCCSNATPRPFTARAWPERKEQRKRAASNTPSRGKGLAIHTAHTHAYPGS